MEHSVKWECKALRLPSVTGSRLARDPGGPIPPRHLHLGLCTVYYSRRHVLGAARLGDTLRSQKPVDTDSATFSKLTLSLLYGGSRALLPFLSRGLLLPKWMPRLAVVFTVNEK